MTTTGWIGVWVFGFSCCLAAIAYWRGTWTAADVAAACVASTLTTIALMLTARWLRRRGVEPSWRSLWL